MSKNGLSRMAINARLGDGMLGKGKNANITYMSTDKLLLEHKERLLRAEGYEGIRWGTQPSGYGGTKTIYNMTTFVSEKATAVRDLPVEDVLRLIDEQDLILWYLDDGSWHVRANTMHLYSNMLDAEQTQLLVDRIEQLYGIAPRIRIDRKRDGRSFYYLYFQRDLVVKFRPIVRQYLIDNALSTLYYKVGGLDFVDKPVAYLTDDAVRSIRLMYDGGTPLKEIAAQVNLRTDRVRNIVNRKTYANVI